MRFEDKCKERMMALEKLIMEYQAKMKKWTRKTKPTLKVVSGT